MFCDTLSDFFAVCIYLFICLFKYLEALSIDPKALRDIRKQSLIDLDRTLDR